VARADVQHPDIRPAGFARKLEPEIDRDFLAVKQPDLPAKEREHLGSRGGNARGRINTGAPEAEDSGVFQEERPLLRKQQREARKVDLPGIDLRFAEVRVQRPGQFQAGGEVVEHVEARLAREDIVPGHARMKPASGGEGPDIQADALRETLQIRDLAGF